MNDLPAAFFDSTFNRLSYSELRRLQKSLNSPCLAYHIEKRVEFSFHLKHLRRNPSKPWQYAFKFSPLDGKRHSDLDNEIATLDQFDCRYMRFTSINFYNERQNEVDISSWLGPTTTDIILKSILPFVLSRLTTSFKTLQLKCREYIPFLEKLTLSGHVFEDIALVYCGPICLEFLRHSLAFHSIQRLSLDGNWPQCVIRDLEQYILSKRPQRLAIYIDEAEIRISMEFISKLLEKANIDEKFTLFMRFKYALEEGELTNHEKLHQTVRRRKDHQEWIVNNRRIVYLKEHGVDGEYYVLRICSTSTIFV
ncbi:hypothetical protein QR680_000249 [Steinernema hermaphroditum]|uniref:F-box domain-containing protein n=1 Tax=Steinernema hermaphroditum TaxID=289476 RepID=A0AA39GU00_9BILA|nr:hypothetical protein QR680_000249 [Steinernema hermaphroditum]